MIAWADGSIYAPQSGLSEGKWVKIRVDETGIYKITYAELAKMGFPDPGKVSIHGYGGWMLDEKFSNQYIDDVPAVAVWKGSDYLLFYAKGPVKWHYGSQSILVDASVFQFIHENNPYSSYGYYFVTDADSARTMASIASLENGSSLQINTFDDYMLYEQEQVSVNNSGRELFGENYESITSRTFSFSIPGITDDAGRVTFRFVSKALGTIGRVSLGIDGTEMMNGTIRIDDNIYTNGVEYLNSVAWNGAKNENTTVSVAYNPSGHKSYLDYIYLQMKRQLKSYAQNGKPYTFFRNLSARTNISTFTIADATSDMIVLDVTDGINPTVMETSLSGSSMSFTIPAMAELREYALVDLSKSFKSPEIIGQIPNQNLHSLPQTDMVIVAPPIFNAEAKRLADYHLTHNPNIDNITIVVPEQVYNEFSSGTPDATALRRFMKMFYDRSTSDEDAPKYLLLFGDGSYDNRRLTDVWKKTPTENYILTYQSQNSLNENSYTMDDYYGFLGDNSGGSVNFLDDIMLNIGRFPVQNTTQAKIAVDKAIAYMDNATTGNWKNNLCFLADDGSNLDGYDSIHMVQSNTLADEIGVMYPEFMINKLFFDTYKKSTVGGRTTYPDIVSGLQKQLKEGAMILNYTGHGNNSSLSDEQVITSSDIRQATYPFLPLWITATCDFTPFDGFDISAGEEVFLNPVSGGIALLTTTRVAYSRPNFSINELILENLFKKENGRRLTLGEVVRATKQSYKNESRLRFTLIGDPALTLAFPDYRINITEINGEAVSNKEFNFRALESISVKGEILAPDGEKASDFDGMIYSTVTDSRQTITTLDNNRLGESFQYEDYPNILYKGNERVNGGEFSFSFTVPKDISYSNRFGKMSLYAVSDQSNNEAQGSFLQFRVGGTDENAEVDSIGPEIRALFLNDSTFTDGGQVNDTPYFVAVLWDQRGINIAGSSIGHDLMLVIDNNPLYSYNLNSYYTSTPGTNGEGTIRFSIPTLPVGVHTAEFKAWNVLNRSTTKTFTFEVVEGLKPRITSLIAAPVPARENVEFRLAHSLPESRMTVNIRVYDMIGRLCWDYEETGVSDLFRAHTITWDLTDGGGKRLLPGVYIYRAAVRTATSTEVSEAKKLVILGR
ncbi:MAG: type IX secretion system sortase PorU [Tannerella sp.]|jgi:hypothetical protein|nr:type IX secretion system sortase PorU [Tannerella sp.]